MINLRQSTASQEVLLGPFVDSTDGVTAETALTIANTDIKVWKAGATTLANKNSGGATHISAGNYYAVLDATDTDTVGSGAIIVQVSGALPIRVPFHVYEEAVFDALYAASATGYLQPTVAGRTLDVSAGGEAGIDWANIGSPTTAVNLSGTNIDVDQVVASVSGAVASVTTVSSGAISEASFATTAGSFAPLGIIDQGTAQSATATTLVLRSAAAFADDEIIGATIVITGGSTGVGQARLITDYVSTTDTATVDTWTTTPTGTITYKIFGTAAGASGGGLDAAGVRAAIGLASANLDTQLSGIQSDTNDIQTRIPAALVSGRIDASVGEMAANVITAASMAADASAEIADAVWDEDATGHQTQGTFGQAIGDPGADTDTIWGLVNTNLNATISSRASQTSLDTLDDYVDTEIGALTTAVADLPTNAELATALGTADDAILAVLGSPAGASVSADIAAVKADTAAVKAKTDSLTFTQAGHVDANIQRINDVIITGNGQVGTEFNV